MPNTHLQNPGFLEIDDAYRSLQRHGEISIQVDKEKLEETLSLLEGAGFVAIQVKLFPDGDHIRRVRAFKGKHGPCYDTGQKAMYRGAALAALDDDNHLLLSFREIPVCQKTAAIYSLSPYQDLIRCSQPSIEDPDQLAYFNCDSFEEDQDRLFGRLEHTPKIEDRSLLYYPGPFRLLILADGTVVRRGRMNSVPAPESESLIARDLLFRTPGPPESPEWFQEVFASQGSSWLLGGLTTHRELEGDRNTDLSRLSGISMLMKNRLTGLIHHGKRYFVLIGSDPSDQFGCCPSEEVAEANALVRAGILDSYSQAAYGNGCPVTICAFKGEVKSWEDKMEFEPNTQLRASVLDELKSKPRETARALIRWMLLGFVSVSILLAVKKWTGTVFHSPSPTLFAQLAPMNHRQVMVLLFHYRKRCDQCLNMERFTRDVLREGFQSEIDNREIQFRLVDMDAAENRNMVTQLGLYTASIVLVKLGNAEVAKTRVLHDAFKLANREEDFKSSISRELSLFVRDTHE